jgi:signal transduction histidine kinase
MTAPAKTVSILTANDSSDAGFQEDGRRMITRRSWWIYGLLLAIWAVILGWQVVEHSRVRKSARAALINRAKDISDTLGLVMRSQRRWGGVISKERMESTLNDLIRPGELNAIALLNAAGEVVASAGEAIDLQPKGVARNPEQWEDRTVTLMNLVDLGTNVTQDLQPRELTIVVPRHELTNRPPPPPPSDRPPPPASETITNFAVAADAGDATNTAARPPGRGRGRGRDGRSGFGRPPWMNEEEYKSVIQRQGVHSFVLVMSTRPFQAVCHQDLWLRAVIGILASISVVGCGLAWQNLAKSSDLQIRLVRASELNAHLKEMNIAAAGLAHETRNPLNIIRGMAQLISKQDDAAPEVRKRSRDIIDETDRVTAQLNEFINYSRPREVRQTAVALGAVVSEVARALSYDIEEKNIDVKIVAEPLTIEADEQLLRQALFNLVLNAVQAVQPNGEIQIRASKRNGAGAVLEVCDNGPGVPAENRSRIFKPYFTTSETGTGLGLAVVQQIVLAHGWEIECLASEPKGAIFRVTHLKLADRS